MNISKLIFGVFMAVVLAVSCKPDPITPEDPAPEIKVTGATSTTQMTGHSFTSKLKHTSNLYK